MFRISALNLLGAFILPLNRAVKIIHGGVGMIYFNVNTIALDGGALAFLVALILVLWIARK